MTATATLAPDTYEQLALIKGLQLDGRPVPWPIPRWTECGRAAFTTMLAETRRRQPDATKKTVAERYDHPERHYPRRHRPLPVQFDPVPRHILQAEWGTADQLTPIQRRQREDALKALSRHGLITVVELDHVEFVVYERPDGEIVEVAPATIGGKPGFRVSVGRSPIPIMRGALSAATALSAYELTAAGEAASEMPSRPADSAAGPRSTIEDQIVAWCGQRRDKRTKSKRPLPGAALVANAVKSPGQALPVVDCDPRAVRAILDEIAKEISTNAVDAFCLTTSSGSRPTLRYIPPSPPER